MEKNITFPTDGKLYLAGVKHLNKFAKAHSIELRQSYTFLARKACRRAAQYAHARQMKRCKRENRRLSTYLGRLLRDIERKVSDQPIVKTLFEPLKELLTKVLAQTPKSKNKIYSLHEPEVECIAKGKAHKKYEFGCKTSIVITHREGIALCVDAVHGNPFDGHTLEASLKKAEQITSIKVRQAYVDRGYRGAKPEGKKIFISGQRKDVTRWYKKELKRRQAIEPHIGHMKRDGRLGINYLKGKLGDHLNATLCGIGHNIRLILNYLGGAPPLPIT